MGGLIRRRVAGFTMVEVMIAVVIISIIAAIAIPSYQESVRKSRRADAKAVLSQLAQRLERCYTQFGRYNDANCSVDDEVESDEGYYLVEVERQADSYQLTAAGKGPQADDKACTALLLDHLGERSATGQQPDHCW